MVFDLIYFINIIISFLIAAYLWIKLTPKHFTLHTKSLSAYYFFNAICFSFYLLIKYKYILFVPFLYKIAAPITYLILPAAYFHVKSIVKKQVAFQRNDWIHIVPFIIFLISYLPFYFQDFETKSAYIALVLDDISLIPSDNIGLFPEVINNLGRIFQPLVYIVLQWLLLKSADGVLLKTTQKTLFAWLLNFVRIQTFLFSSLLVTVFTSQYFLPSIPESIFQFIPLFLTVCSFFILSNYLFWNQKILQKLKYLNPYEKAVDNNNEKLDINVISAIVYEQNYFKGTENDLVGIANKLGLNKTELSKLIKTKHVNFNAWINTLKVKNSIELIKEGYLDNYSIAALASECGFKSTTTFYRAFKAQTKTTPREYTSSSF